MERLDIIIARMTDLPSVVAIGRAAPVDPATQRFALATRVVIATVAVVIADMDVQPLCEPVEVLSWCPTGHVRATSGG